MYVHAELHGASTTVIKNQQPDQPIPPLTISQVCRPAANPPKCIAGQTRSSQPTRYAAVNMFSITPWQVGPVEHAGRTPAHALSPASLLIMEAPQSI